MTTLQHESDPSGAVPAGQAIGDVPARRSLARFVGVGYTRGRNSGWQIAWLVTSRLITEHWWCPPGVRANILRAFGARVGRGTNIRHGVRIHWPWKLTVGDNSWIGEQAWILNLEPVTIGADVCISQGVLLCTGSHDRHSPTFEFDNGPITVGDGAWIAARATVLRGTTIGHDSVIGATALVSGDVEPGALILAPRAHAISPASGL